MCGINGFLKQNISENTAIQLLENMNASIRHRGPDDQGVFMHEKNNRTLGLGHVRLSIVDLSPAGHQPMFYTKESGTHSSVFHPSDDQSLALVFNGEIYNFHDLKNELVALGYHFSTHSDTEVILASYLEWGAYCVNRFNGMWALALYDEKNDILLCSRDRFGKKPFYYYHDGEYFIFSSEIKGILTHNIPQEIDPEAVDFYFTTGFIPAPWSIYTNVRKIEAGHSLIIDTKTLAIRNERYYEIPYYTPSYDRKALIQEGKNLLENATKIRMFADVPVGAFLSGGLDSSSVVAEMTKFVKKEHLHTFSIGFEGKYDETPYINIVKDAFGTNHHHAYFKKEHFESMIDEIPQIYDEPFGDYSNFPTTFVSKLARQHVTVSLSGDGGDEVFGGYMMHQIGAQMSVIRKIPMWIRTMLHTIIPKTGNNLSVLSKLKEAMRVSLLPKESFYAEIAGTSLYKPKVFQEWTREKLRYCLERTNGDFTQALIDYDLLYNTLGDNFLVKTDRASMSCSLEIRSPFLDYRFIAYARKIPVKWKVNWRKTKILMRDIICDIVPEAIWNRGKQGFEPPIKDWILAEKHMQEIRSGIEELHRENILSPEWYRFYTEEVLTKNNSVFNVAKVRMFLFIKWYNIYIKHT
ncbi:MAG: asparagine synthase (glutamine-hydrolyzing) [Candidatus Gracilibacteria bacterium]|nr:asparagine synthase (glutamine-hydrolyzing) [Candidatus Gracilibacteria bacterium]